jgi:hypothetical protein
MSAVKCKISLLVIVTLLTGQAFSQGINDHDSISPDNSQQRKIKPRMSYSVGSTFMFIPHHGSVTGFTVSPSLSVPVSSRLSFNAGIIAGHYYSGFRNPTLFEGQMNGSFNDISVFGSANYHVNPQLTFYGAGIKRLTAPAPYSTLPNSSYLVGTTYKFGSFSIGISMQMSQWNYNYNPLPINGRQGFYSPFEPGPVIW